MDLTKFVLLLHVVTLSLCTRQYPTEDYIRLLDGSKKPLQWLTSPAGTHPNYGYFRNVNKLTNNLRDCFCFLQKSNGVPVTQKVNPSGQNLERLVLYLYRDTSSSDIKLYLPNSEKQLMIPDLAFDDGDRLETLPSETAEALFTSYTELVTDHNRLNSDIVYIHPGKVNKNVKTPDLLDILDPSLPKEIVYVNGIENGINTINSDSDQSGNDNIQKTIVNIHTDSHKIVTKNRTEESDPNFLFNIVSEQQNVITVDETKQMDIDLELENLNDFSKEEVNKHEAIKPFNKEFIVNKEYLHLDYEDDYYLNSHDLFNGGQQKHIIPNNELDSLRPNNVLEDFDLLDPEDFEKISDSNFDKYVKPDIYNFINKGKTYEQEIYDLKRKPGSFNSNRDVEFEEIYKPIKNDILEQPEAIKYIDNPIIWTNLQDRDIVSTINRPVNYRPQKPQLMFIEKLKPRLVKQHQQPHNLHKVRNLEEMNFRNKFDIWFNEQLKLVNFDNSAASNSIDIYTFKYLIEKTLYDNGLYITEKGLFSDSEGTFFDINNISLRPILIGNSVEYKNLLKGKISTLKLQTGTPYLEAILIISINPQKILGIVPLGKTYLPKNYRNPLSLYIEDEQSHPNIGMPSCDRSCKMSNYIRPNNLHNANLIKSQQHALYTPIYRRLLPNKAVAENDYRKLPQLPEASNIENDSQESTHRGYPFDQVQTITNTLHDEPENKIEPKEGHRVKNVKNNRKPVISGVKPKYPFMVPKVKPGFRIIGGNAATSSGTPLSSKGRSGYDSSETSEEFSEEYEIIN